MAHDHDKANEILECTKGSITARDKEVLLQLDEALARLPLQ